MDTKTARALANQDQPGNAVMGELTDYVVANVDPNARRVTSATVLLSEPLDASGRACFQVTYE